MFFNCLLWKSYITIFFNQNAQNSYICKDNYTLMILLAPLQGYTDFIFRNIYSKYYSGIDVAVSPFIPMMQQSKGSLIVAKDVLPANNSVMPVIPQVLGNNPDLFISVAKILSNLGYNQINWNMGCPVKNSTRKKRGAGLLPYPELVNEILEKVIYKIPQRLSIKLRLGLNNTNEIYQLIPVLNNFPIENVTIHPRIGIQMYEGEVHHNVLSDIIPLIKHEIIYNGDICSLEDFQNIRKKYPTIQKWMIGRGVFYNPLLPAILKGENISSSEINSKNFLSFLLDLYQELLIYKSEYRTVCKIKDLWALFSKRFVNDENIFYQISHVFTIEEMIQTTKKIFEKEEMMPWR